MRISDSYEYVDEDHIHVELKCPICKQPFESPVILNVCEHTFCKTCIDQCLILDSHCPVCRKDTSNLYTSLFELPSLFNNSSVYKPVFLRIVLNQLDGLDLRCLRCNTSDIKRSNWKHHEENCTKRIVPCPSANIKCKWEGPFDTLNDHIETCPLVKIKPTINELNYQIQKYRNRYYDLTDELKDRRMVENQLRTSVNLLEKRVDFLLKFINHGDIMTCNRDMSKNECSCIPLRSKVCCTMCLKQVRRRSMAVHSRNGNYICQSCVNEQYTNQTETTLINRSSSEGDEE